MNEIYDMLFNSYAHDIQLHLKESEKETLKELAQLIPLSDENMIDLTDRLAILQKCCRAESLLLGIQIGLRLSREITAL